MILNDAAIAAQVFQRSVSFWGNTLQNLELFDGALYQMGSNLALQCRFVP